MPPSARFMIPAMRHKKRVYGHPAARVDRRSTVGGPAIQKIDDKAAHTCCGNCFIDPAPQSSHHWAGEDRDRAPLQGNEYAFRH
jgi:hypothetical protein